MGPTEVKGPVEHVTPPPPTPMRRCRIDNNDDGGDGAENGPFSPVGPQKSYLGLPEFDFDCITEGVSDDTPVDIVTFSDGGGNTLNFFIKHQLMTYHLLWHLSKVAYL